MNPSSASTSVTSSKLVHNRWSEELNSLRFPTQLLPFGVHIFDFEVEHSAGVKAAAATGETTQKQQQSASSSTVGAFLEYSDDEREDDASDDNSSSRSSACQLWFTPLLRSTGIIAADVRNSVIFSNDGVLLNTGMKAANAEKWSERKKMYQLKACVDFFHRRIYFQVGSQPAASTPLASSLVDSPLYLHIASSGSFIHLKAYDFNSKPQPIVRSIRIQDSTSTETRKEQQEDQQEKEEDVLDEVADIVMDQQDEQMLQVDQDVEDSPQPISGYSTTTVGNGVDCVKEITVENVQEDAMIDIEEPVDAVSSMVLSSASCFSYSNSNTSAFASSLSISTVAHSSTSDWSTYELFCFLVAIILASISSAQALAAICRHIMS